MEQNSQTLQGTQYLENLLFMDSIIESANLSDSIDILSKTFPIEKRLELLEKVRKNSNNVEEICEISLSYIKKNKDLSKLQYTNSNSYKSIIGIGLIALSFGILYLN